MRGWTPGDPWRHLPQNGSPGGLERCLPDNMQCPKLSNMGQSRKIWDCRASVLAPKLGLSKRSCLIGLTLCTYWVDLGALKVHWSTVGPHLGLHRFRFDTKVRALRMVPIDRLNFWQGWGLLWSAEAPFDHIRPTFGIAGFPFKHQS